MYRANPIWIYWSKAIKSVKISLQLLKKEISKEQVHELRVGIKKLKACAALHIRLQGDKKKSGISDQLHLNKIFVVFDTCGRQRDIEICLEILPVLEMQTGKKLNHFRAFLESVLKTSYSWSHSSVRNFCTTRLNSITGIIREELRKTDQANTTKKIGTIIKKGIESAKKSCHKPHLLRKKLKTLYYWVTILDEKDTRLQHLSKILDDLGQWQDDEIILNRMKHFRKDFLPKPIPEQQSIRQSEKKLTREKEKLLRSLSLSFT